MIGGSGERKTLRLVAQYADACNIFFGPEAPRKLDVLRRHCDDLGRDHDTIEKTTISAFGPETTAEEVLGILRQARDDGFSVTYLMPSAPRPLEAVGLLASLRDEIAAI